MLLVVDLRYCREFGHFSFHRICSESFKNFKFNT